MTTKEEYQAYLTTDYWREVSDAVKQRAGHRCQVCNSSLKLEAHHRTYAHRGNEKEYLDDLVCLCHSCHKKFHFAPDPSPKKKKKWRRNKNKHGKGMSYFSRKLKRQGWWEPKKIEHRPYDPNKCLDKSLNC